MDFIERTCIGLANVGEIELAIHPGCSCEVLVSDDHRTRSAALHADRPVARMGPVCSRFRSAIAIDVPKRRDTRSARHKHAASAEPVPGETRQTCLGRDGVTAAIFWSDRIGEAVANLTFTTPAPISCANPGRICRLRAARFGPGAGQKLLGKTFSSRAQVASSFRRRLDTCGPRSGAAVRRTLVSATVLRQTRTSGQDGQETGRR